jgi:hypothetical protein
MKYFLTITFSVLIGVFLTIFLSNVTAGTNEGKNIRIGFNQSIDNKGVIYLNGFSSTFKGSENEIWPSDENISKGITGKKFGDKSAKSILVVMIDGKSYTAIDVPNGTDFSKASFILFEPNKISRFYWSGIVGEYWNRN